MKFIRNVSGVLAACAAATLLCACETIKGVGRDIENTGEALEDAID